MADRGSVPVAMPQVRRRAALVIAGLAVAVGIAGFVASSNEAFAAHLGPPLWHILHFNRLGAIVTVAVGAVAAIGAGAGRRALVAVAGFLFAGAWVLTLVQTGRTTNWLGGRGDTMALFMAAAVGLLTIALVPNDSTSAPIPSAPPPPEQSDAASP